MAKRKKPTTISEQLRDRIATSRLSPYELAQASGVDRSVLSRFLAGKRSLTLDTVDKLAAVLDFRLEGR
jgi:plasmid maintenance system antidote protein VapI